jgi:hypothetical protein
MTKPKRQAKKPKARTKPDVTWKPMPEVVAANKAFERHVSKYGKICQDDLWVLGFVAGIVWQKKRAVPRSNKEREEMNFDVTFCSGLRCDRTKSCERGPESLRAMIEESGQSSSSRWHCSVC